MVRIKRETKIKEKERACLKRNCSGSGQGKGKKKQLENHRAALKKKKKSGLKGGKGWMTPKMQVKRKKINSPLATKEGEGRNKRNP